MKQVKGSILITVVKGIKANHQKKQEFDEILSDKAKQLLKERILPGTWYPFDIYRELNDALCFIDARNDPKTLHEWGRNDAKRSFATIYKSSIVKGDLQASVEGYLRFHKRVYNFSEIIPEFISDTELVLTYKDMPHDWENWYHLAKGFATVFIELCLDKKVDYSFLNKSWKGEGWTKVRLSWSP